MAKAPKTRDLIAEFDGADAMVGALRNVKAAGYPRLETYTPYPVQGVDEILEQGYGPLPFIIFAVGLGGAILGFLIQYYGMAIDYPMNIGGRPLNSWPAFSTTTFEMGALAIVLLGTGAFLALSRLPRLYDPIFEVRDFERVSQDRFMIRVRLRDDADDIEDLRKALEPHKPLRLTEVPS